MVCFVNENFYHLLGDQRVGAGETGQRDDRNGWHRKQM